MLALEQSLRRRNEERQFWPGLDVINLFWHNLDATSGVFPYDVDWGYENDGEIIASNTLQNTLHKILD